MRTLADQQNNPTALMEANKFIPSQLTLLEEAIIDSNSVSAEGDQVSSAVWVSSKSLLCAPEPSTPETSCPTTKKEMRTIRNAAVCVAVCQDQPFSIARGTKADPMIMATTSSVTRSNGK